MKPLTGDYFKVMWEPKSSRGGKMILNVTEPKAHSIKSNKITRQGVC